METHGLHGVLHGSFHGLTWPLPLVADAGKARVRALPGGSMTRKRDTVGPARRVTHGRAADIVPLGYRYLAGYGEERRRGNHEFRAFLPAPLSVAVVGGGVRSCQVTRK